MTQVDPTRKTTTSEVHLYCAMELSGKNWRLAFSKGDLQVRERVVACGQIEQVVQEFGASVRRFEMEGPVTRLACYEAGRDGFWIQRALEEQGIQTLVIDPSSLQVDRRQKQAKTDRLDVKRILAALIRYCRGEKSLRVVSVPTVEQEDARRVNRERDRLKQESTQHRNRVHSLLMLHGIRCKTVRGNAKMRAKVLSLTSPTGEALPPQLRTEIERELIRLELVEQQIAALEKARNEKARKGAGASASKVRRLEKVRGIGPTGAAVLVEEIFGWREFRNRRQLGALVGLTPTPFSSGNSERDQGISKAGSRRLRALLVQLSWGWLRFQPQSALTKWFLERFAKTARGRRIGIVAVARKLLVALWRYLEQGVIPAGALMSA